MSLMLELECGTTCALCVMLMHIAAQFMALAMIVARARVVADDAREATTRYVRASVGAFAGAGADRAKGIPEVDIIISKSGSLEQGKVFCTQVLCHTSVESWRVPAVLVLVVAAETGED